MSDPLWPHEPQHARPPYPSPTPEVHPNPCASSRWCHSTISSSVIPFFSCPQSFPTSGSFPISQLFPSGGQSFGVSASTSVLPMNTQDWSIWFRMDWLDLLAVQGTLKSLLQHHSSKASILQCWAFFMVQLSHTHWKNHSIRWPKDWSFIFSISHSNEYSGWISFRTDWFDLLAVQGSLSRLLQCYSLEASVLQCSAFFMVQLSHLYMTTGKTTVDDNQPQLIDP